MWEGGSESCSTKCSVWDKLNPQDVTNQRGVVWGERGSAEATDQMPSGVALSDFQVVILTVSISLQLKRTEQNTRRLLVSNEAPSKYKTGLMLTS